MNNDKSINIEQDGNGVSEPYFRKLIKILIGPGLLFFALLLPFLGPMEARLGFGILFWMIYWWVSGAVDFKITALVPLMVVVFYPFVSHGEALALYVHKHAFLIIGASMITCSFVEWDLAKRISLRFMMMFSNRVQVQMVAWFILSSVVSFVLGNTPVGAIFAPIAVAALFVGGYVTYQQRYNSKAATNILIAVAWGASIGGMTTPLGGGQAVITWAFFQEYIGQEIFFLDWTLRMLPLSILIMATMAFFMYFFMKPDPEEERFSGTADYHRQELAKMGPMKWEEKICLYGFAGIVALAITRPFYADLVAGPWFTWLSPSPLFFIFAMLLFLIPSRRKKGDTLLSIPILVKYFPSAILFIWPGAVALGRTLNITGVGDVFAGWMAPFIEMGDMASIIATGLGSTFLSQFLTDTGAAGVLIPLVINAFDGWRGLEFGSVAFIWISGAALSWSLAVVSATGAQAICAGYGANIKRMFYYGIACSALCAVVTVVYFVITIGIMNLDFYILPPVR